MRPILAIALTTVGEAIRRRVLLIILFAGLLLLTIIPGLSVLSARGQSVGVVTTMYFVIQYTAMFIAIVLSMYMIPNEIERRTIYVILSKPVTRWQFLLGKYFGAVFAIGLMMALMTIVSLVVFAVNQGGDVSRMATLSQGPVLFFIQMCLLAAVTIFFSTFVAPLVNFFLSIGIYLMGTSLSSLYDSYVKNPEITGPVRFLAETITLALPNFDKYNIANPIIHPGQVIQNPMTYYVNVTGYGIIYIAGLLIAGILIFDRREV